MNMLRIDDVYGEAGSQTNSLIVVALPNSTSILHLYLNGKGKEKQFQQNNLFVTLNDPLSFPGLYLPRTAQVFNNTMNISDLLLEQLQQCQLEYPISWSENELNDLVIYLYFQLLHTNDIIHEIILIKID